MNSGIEIKHVVFYYANLVSNFENTKDINRKLNTKVKLKT